MKVECYRCKNQRIPMSYLYSLPGWYNVSGRSSWLMMWGKGGCLLEQKDKKPNCDFELLERQSFIKKAADYPAPIYVIKIFIHDMPYIWFVGRGTVYIDASSYSYWKMLKLWAKKRLRNFIKKIEAY